MWEILSRFFQFRFCRHRLLAREPRRPEDSRGELPQAPNMEEVAGIRRYRSNPHRAGQ
jgi:hypothetical protein